LRNPYVTGFVKRGLPHTSNSMNLEDCNLGFKAHTNLHQLTYFGAHCCPNFKGMAVFNLTLLIVKVIKLDVCGKPLFANPVLHAYLAVLQLSTCEVQML